MSEPRTDRATAATSSLAIVGAFACLACTLLLIAATIVLALIPVFISERQVSVDADRTKSNQVEVVANIDGNSEDPAKRALNDTFLGCSVDSNGTLVIRNFFLKYLPTTIVSGLTINNVTIGTRDSGSGYALRILLVILYKPSCLYACQIKNSGTLRSRFQNLNDTGSSFGKLTLLKDGKVFRRLSIIAFATALVSNILPAVISSSGSGFYSPVASNTSSNTSTSGNSSTNSTG